MGKKYRTYESFETNGSNYIALYYDMFDSKAWKSLTSHSRDLYLYMRRKYSRTVCNVGIIKSNKDNISVTEPEIKENKLMSISTFWDSIDSLIDKGFIIVKHRGTRFDEKKCNIYAFHDGWKNPKYQARPEDTRGKVKKI